MQNDIKSHPILSAALPSQTSELIVVLLRDLVRKDKCSLVLLRLVFIAAVVWLGNEEVRKYGKYYWEALQSAHVKV